MGAGRRRRMGRRRMGMRISRDSYGGSFAGRYWTFRRSAFTKGCIIKSEIRRTEALEEWLRLFDRGSGKIAFQFGAEDAKMLRRFGDLNSHSTSSGD